MFAFWAMMLGVVGMYSLYIVEMGYSKAQVSIAVSIYTFSSLIGQNILGYFAERYKCVKKILLITISIGILASSALLFTDRIIYIYIVISIWAFSLYGSIPLTEVWAIQFLKANSKENDFGKIRGVGSVGYGISGIILGFMLEKLGWSIYIFYILVIASFVLLCIFLMPDLKDIKSYNIKSEDNKGFEKISIREALTQILSIKKLKSFVLIIFLYSFVIKGIYVYLGVIVTDSGGGPLSVGFTYFFDASPELISFFLAARLLRKYSSKNMVLAAIIIQIVRLTLILVFNSALAITLLGILSGFAYGLNAAAYKTYIYDLAPEKYKISCLSFCESIIVFSGVLSAPVFGFVIMKFGTYASIAMGLAIDIVAVIMITVSIIREKNSMGNNTLPG